MDNDYFCDDRLVRYMNGQTDGRSDGWMDGWMVGERESTKVLSSDLLSNYI